jgi:hypothetical protein
VTSLVGSSLGKGSRLQSYSYGGYTVVSTQTGGQILDSSGKVVMAGDVDSATGDITYTAGAGKVVFPYPSGGKLQPNQPNDLGNGVQVTPTSQSGGQGALTYTDGSGISGTFDTTQSGNQYTVTYQDSVTPKTILTYTQRSGGGGWNLS